MTSSGLFSHTLISHGKIIHSYFTGWQVLLRTGKVTFMCETVGVPLQQRECAMQRYCIIGCNTFPSKLNLWQKWISTLLLLIFLLSALTSKRIKDSHTLSCNLRKGFHMSSYAPVHEKLKAFIVKLSALTHSMWQRQTSAWHDFLCKPYWTTPSPNRICLGVVSWVKWEVGVSETERVNT